MKRPLTLQIKNKQTDILKNLQKDFESIDSRPVAIAMAMTSLFKSQLSSHMRPNSGLKIYILEKLPEPFRIYYDLSKLDLDIVLYSA